MRINILKKFIVLFGLVFVLLGFNSTVLAQNGSPIITYTLNGISDNITVNPVINPVQVGFVSDENIENWVSIKIEKNDLSVHKYFYPSENSCDGKAICSKLWDGHLSDGTIASNGIYNVIVKIKSDTIPTYDVSLTSWYTITVDIPVPQSTLSSIAITTPATKLNYTVGEVLDITDLVVTGTYSDDSEKVEEITVDNITGFDSTIPVDGQTLIVTVGEQITTYIVNISDTPPVLDFINIHLEVISGTDLPIYDNDISVVPCDSDNDSTTPNTITPYCVIKQLENLGTPILSDWSWYGTSAFVNSIGEISSDSINFKYWTWLANLDFNNFSLAASQYELQPNDQILFYFDTNPLKISDINLTPEVGSELDIKVTEPDYGPWPPVWASSVGGKIVISSNSFDLDSNGDYKLNITSTDPIIIKGQKNGYIDSPSITITPAVSNEEDEDVCTNSATNPPICDNNSGGGSGSPTTLVVEKTFDLDNAFNFLSQNKESVSIVSIYDWIAISAGAGDNSNLKSDLIDYLKSNPINSSILTENERRAMSLMALGINPYDGTEINYIQKIINSFNGTQFDDDSLSDINDDIFAMIVLQNAGYTKNDEIIKKDIAYIISKQLSSGSWGSVDMTAAGIMALNDFKEVDEVIKALSNANNYLIGVQNADGGFANTSSTSWAIQALSLDNSFSENVNNAIKYLIMKQQSDGGLDGYDMNSRIWVTSYAIPAALHKSWNEIMQNFEKSTSQNNSSSNVLEDTDLSNIIHVVICPKGHLFSTKTGQACNTIEEVDTVTTNIPIVTQNLNSIKKVENKKIVEISKTKKIINPEIIQNPLNQTSEISAENNLGASAGNVTSIKIPIKGIFQTIIHSVVNILAYIGKGFYVLVHVFAK